MRQQRAVAPFTTVAIVLLPDHPHAMWTLPPGDDDYTPYNPVKHGRAQRPRDWPWSSFHRYVQSGDYAADWGSTQPASTHDVDADLIE